LPKYRLIGEASSPEELVLKLKAAHEAKKTTELRVSSQQQPRRISSFWRRHGQDK